MENWCEHFSLNVSDDVMVKTVRDMFEFAVDSDFDMGDEYEEYCKEFHRFEKKRDDANKLKLLK